MGKWASGHAAMQETKSDRIPVCLAFKILKK